MASLLVLDNVCHLICSRCKESPQRGYGEFLFGFLNYENFVVLSIKAIAAELLR